MVKDDGSGIIYIYIYRESCLAKKAKLDGGHKPKKRYASKKVTEFPCPHALKGECEYGPFKCQTDLDRHMLTHEFVKDGLCA